MSLTTEQNTQVRYARIAGLSYIIFTIAGFINSFLLNGKLSDVTSFSVNGMFENEMHFRFGLMAETIMFLGVVMASISFYTVLKSANKQLAQTALCLRLIEIIAGGIAVIIGMAMLALANKASLQQIFEPEQLRTLIVIAASFKMPAYEYSWISMGVAGVITFYLFYTTRYIPRFWAIWGMITYTSLILYPSAKLLIPDLPREVMFVMFPGALFELCVGFWLLIKGVNISTNHSDVSSN